MQEISIVTTIYVHTIAKVKRKTKKTRKVTWHTIQNKWLPKIKMLIQVIINVVYYQESKKKIILCYSLRDYLTYQTESKNYETCNIVFEMIFLIKTSINMQNFYQITFNPNENTMNKILKAQMTFKHLHIHKPWQNYAKHI